MDERIQNNSKSDTIGTQVCLCEPFILPGILPTLGTPTLKSVLDHAGIASTILYPSLHFFLENRFYEDAKFMKCISDIPLQFSEFLFEKEHSEESVRFLEEKTGLNCQNEVKHFLQASEAILQKTAEKIINSKATVLTYSLTFGDYNFAFRLFDRVKAQKNDMVIVVGGSMCTPALADDLLMLCPHIDYVLCDEDVFIYENLVNAVLKKKNFNNECVAQKGISALKVNKISDLNHLPCPNFSDFLFEIQRLGLNKDKVIVPYEVSRGCWWGEKKSCAMCGYFGYQKCFIIKQPQKVMDDLKLLHDKFSINYVRFTDLVQPQKDYLKKLDSLASLGMNFFWELRPNLKEEDIALLRNMGVFYSQIGLESLSTDELKYMHKGTTSVNNIYLLILFMSYKIRIDWNYLYGFEEDQKIWYEEAIEIIPKLYHLFPPQLRQVWINRESRIFYQTEEKDLEPVGSKIFHKGFPDEIEVFYQGLLNPQLQDVYLQLADSIEKWKNSFSSGYQLCIIYDDFPGVHILKSYGEDQHYYLSGIEAAIYVSIFQPVSKEKIHETFFNLSEETIDKYLAYFLTENIAILLDGKYLALATRSTKFRWKKYNLIKSIFE